MCCRVQVDEFLDLCAMVCSGALEKEKHFCRPSHSKCIGSPNRELTPHRLGILSIIFCLAFGIGNIFTTVIIFGIISMCVISCSHGAGLMRLQLFRSGPHLCRDTIPPADMSYQSKV